MAVAKSPVFIIADRPVFHTAIAISSVIAAISFFPDYAKSPNESFVYLENAGDMKFKPSTFAESVLGRWLCMDAGDLDGDGDEDIVLGSLVQMPTEVPASIKDGWNQIGPSVMILRNELDASRSWEKEGSGTVLERESTSE